MLMQLFDVIKRFLKCLDDSLRFVAGYCVWKNKKEVKVAVVPAQDVFLV